YACLSYCWGVTEPPLKLSQATIDTLNAGILASTLSKTITDAIYLAHGIGLQWIWIDSLCIYQDCTDDWQQESSRMFDTYQGSFITIAALGASEASQGLYAKRDPLRYAPCPVLVKEDAHPVCIFPSFSTETIGDSPYLQWPLYTRGWVLQERILPPRTVKFGTYISWECRKSDINEFSFRGVDEENREKGLCRRFYENVWKTHDSGSTLAEPQAQYLRNLWETTLQTFTMARLTVPKDRRLAASGLIEGFARRTGWANIFGMWEPFLLEELLWISNGGGGMICPEATGLMPTWSWISLTGRV
ncbi:heterokaryon incompatibility protein-domain-containing protein, partial [Tricladium varicosporioides]